jgi:hypothetical protein
VPMTLITGAGRRSAEVGVGAEADEGFDAVTA